MKKILVTGANGYIGSHVVPALLDLGYEVIATDLRGASPDPRATFAAADLFADPDPYRTFGEPDGVVHLAWRDGFVHQSPAHIEDLPRHYAFLRAMIDAGVGSVSVMGSMHEIGFYEGKVDETTPTDPASLYGIAKNALRQALTVYAASRPVALHWLRAYYILGDDRRNHSIFSKILEKSDAGETSFPFTMGTNRYDFLPIDDLALEIALASVQTGVNGVVNVCSGRPVALKDAVERFLAENGLAIRPQYGAFPDRPYDSREIYGDPGKIRAILADAVKIYAGTPAAERIARLSQRLG